MLAMVIVVAFALAIHDFYHCTLHHFLKPVMRLVVLQKEESN